MINFFDLLSDYSALISVGIALTNLFIVIQVFKFNRRMSQSKLSVSPSLQPTFLPHFSVLLDPEKIDYEITKHKIWIANLDMTYYLSELEDIPHKPGLPIIKDSMLGHYNSIHEDMKTLSLSVKNSGDLPSTNVEVKLLLKTYGTKNFYPKEELNNKLIDRELFSEHVINISVSYLGANDERSFAICNLYGQFRETELILLSIKSNGFTYIKNGIFKNFLRPNSHIILNHYKMDKLTSPDITKEDLLKIYGLENL